MNACARVRIRSVQRDLESVNERLEKMEEQYSHLRAYADRLEAKLAQAQTELSDERNRAAQATDLLEQESTQRLRFEKELGEVRVSSANGSISH